MIQLLLYALGLIVIYATVWFIIAVLKKRNDVADIAWGLGYIFICIFLFITQQHSPVSLLLYVLVFIWGIRLSLHIYLRNKNKKEDFRYNAWREEWGHLFYLRSYLQVFLLQGILLWVIISPVIHAAYSKESPLNVFTWIGIGCWFIGFYFQTVGDFQLSVFIKHKKKDDVLQTGLWKYTRHPNYFGEMMMWWGIFIITLPLKNSIYFIISPITISFLLLFVSGIPLMEKRYEGNKDFEAYKKRTSVLLPMPPKHNKLP